MKLSTNRVFFFLCLLLVNTKAESQTAGEQYRVWIENKEGKTTLNSKDTIDGKYFASEWVALRTTNDHMKISDITCVIECGNEAAYAWKFTGYKLPQSLKEKIAAQPPLSRVTFVLNGSLNNALQLVLK